MIIISLKLGIRIQFWSMRYKGNFSGRFLGKCICSSKVMYTEELFLSRYTQYLWNCSHHLEPGVKLVPSLSPEEPAIERDKTSGCGMVVVCAKVSTSVLAYH